MSQWYSSAVLPEQIVLPNVVIDSTWLTAVALSLQVMAVCLHELLFTRLAILIQCLKKMKLHLNMLHNQSFPIYSFFLWEFAYCSPTYFKNAILFVVVCTFHYILWNICSQWKNLYCCWKCVFKSDDTNPRTSRSTKCTQYSVVMTSSLLADLQSLRLVRRCSVKQPERFQMLSSSVEFISCLIMTSFYRQLSLSFIEVNISAFVVAA